MKKYAIKFILTTLFIMGLVMTVAIAGCGSTTLALDTSAVSTVFEVGDEFNSDNLVVYQKNGKDTERVKKENYSVTAPDMSTAGKKTVTVTSGDMTATYEIEVVVKTLVATFKGKVAFGLGGGRVMEFDSELKCYNTLDWEISSTGVFADGGVYTVKDGVYTMTMGSGAEISTTKNADGAVTFSYEGFGISLMGRLTANGHGILTLQA